MKKQGPVAVAGVSVSVGGGLARVRPAPAGLIRELTYRRITYVAGGPLGYSRRVERVRLYEIQPDGSLLCSAGLLARVVARLKALGHGVSVTDHRGFAVRHRADPAVIAGAVGTDRAFLEAVAREPLGQVEAGGLREVARRSAQVARLFPDLKAIVVAATRAKARALRRVLRHALQEPVAFAVSGVCPSDRRVAVSTYTQLAHFNPEEVGVLLIADGGEAGGEAAKCALPRMNGSANRVYAFVGRGGPAGAAARLCLEAVAGPVIFRRGPEPAEVRVQVCRAASFPAPPCAARGLTRKRRAVWHGAGRNGLVAAVAAAFAGRDAEALWAKGLMLDEADTRWLRDAPRVRVVVLVESAEHGRALRRLLPGWALAALLPGPDGREGQRRRSKGSQATGTIVTLAHAAARGAKADVVVRADGGSAPLRLPGLPPPAAAAPDGRMFLVDFDDDVDAQAARDARRRLGQYAARGWAAGAATPDDTGPYLGEVHEPCGARTAVVPTSPPGAADAPERAGQAGEQVASHTDRRNPGRKESDATKAAPSGERRGNGRAANAPSKSRTPLPAQGSRPLPTGDRSSQPKPGGAAGKEAHMH